MDSVLTTLLDLTAFDVLSHLADVGSTRNTRRRRTVFIPLQPPGISLHHQGHFITPIVTSDFKWNRIPQRKKRTRSSHVHTTEKEKCSICLDNVRIHQSVLLPCSHSFHFKCITAVLPNAALGARSMLRCPLCRFELDRHNLAFMGFDVSVSYLKTVSLRCDSIRLLNNGRIKTPAELATLINNSYRANFADGFLYNVCILPIERAIQHRKYVMQTFLHDRGATFRIRFKI